MWAGTTPCVWRGCRHLPPPHLTPPTSTIPPHLYTPAQPPIYLLAGMPGCHACLEAGLAWAGLGWPGPGAGLGQGEGLGWLAWCELVQPCAPCTHALPSLCPPCTYMCCSTPSHTIYQRPNCWYSLAWKISLAPPDTPRHLRSTPCARGMCAAHASATSPAMSPAAARQLPRSCSEHPRYSCGAGLPLGAMCWAWAQFTSVRN